ncbi:hypothetical protein EI94DRAFT_1801481 [Lactarius quietus]|nr:hypothetical protein EI94DRAFT_1801481 [Lactarius quietus]
MLFSNTLVSFIAAIALASGATASVTPRWDTTPPPPAQPPSQPPSTTTVQADCNAIGGTCCQSSVPVTQYDSSNGGLASALNLGNADNANIGVNCAIEFDSCNTKSFCCNSSQSVESLGGLINGITGVIGTDCNEVA